MKTTNHLQLLPQVYNLLFNVNLIKEILFYFTENNKNGNERVKVANLAAQAAERRLSAKQFPVDVNNTLI